jgi:CheY-like chemotaxis protein/HPt (histidine-containing phosphotransfer) domain-containing protein
MVIDDDAFILQLCDAILTKHNIAHSCYSSPEKAYGDAWDETITLVLMDIRMPMISGHELYRLLKQKAAANVRFVALTAQALPDEKAAILTTGFDQVLLKPFREKDLLQLLTGAAGEVNTPYQAMDRFDLSSIVTMCVNDKALLRKTLQLYTEQTQADLNVLEAAVAAGSRQKIAETCHRLSATMGQTGLHALAQELHATEINSSKANGVVLSAHAFESLKRRIEEAIQQVKDYKII